MVNYFPGAEASQEPTPLYELISRILQPDVPAKTGLQAIFPWSGTLQSLNDRLERSPLLDFLNYNLRGIGQVIFINNPISGLLILTALFLQSPWVGGMSLVGVIVSTLMAFMLRLDRDTIRNGIFGYNGMLVGAALATFGDMDASPWPWAIAVIIFSALTTVLMNTFGVWWAKTVKTPPLTLPFIIATLVCLVLAKSLPFLGLNLPTASDSATLQTLNFSDLGASLAIGIGQVFLVGNLLPGLLIVLAIGLCSPLGAGVGLLGALLGLVVSLILQAPLNSVYAGLWGYNAVLTAMALGGVFYAPNLRSVGIGAIAALVSAGIGGLLSLLFVPFGLPSLTLAFCLVTILVFVLIRRSLPSLVPVALHAVTSPEEHRQRYQSAGTIIRNFRQQLSNAIRGTQSFYLSAQASESMKGDLRYIFNSIDQDQNGNLSIEELTQHLSQAGKAPTEEELDSLFQSMDSDGNGVIDWEEFCELMLRHRHLMTHFDNFTTYFLPIDADGDDAISLDEMNVALSSVGDSPFSPRETNYLLAKMNHRPMTWNRFLEILLVT